MTDIKSDYDLATNIWDRVSIIFKNIWKENDISNDLKKYKTHLQNTFGTIKILGMTEPVNVEEIYVDLNILSKTRETDRILEITDLSYTDLTDYRKRLERRDATDIVNEIQNLFILGKPGAGKTTLLKHITINALKNSNNKHIPVFISLKEFSEDKTHDTLFNFIINQFEKNSFSYAKPFVEKMLKDGIFLILLDGFDEIKISEEDRIINDIRNFRKCHYKNKFIISCRIHASNYIFEDFTDVELADFNYNQVNVFIDKWFYLDKEKSEKCIKLLSYKENKRIRELASQPLLLTLICIYFDEVFDFPRNRAELYEQALSVLLVKWDSTRKINRSTDIYKKLTPKQKIVLYSEIAGQAFIKNKYIFKQDELQTLVFENLTNLSEIKEGVDENEILRSMVAQHGLFTPIANKLYSFSHLTFQEFLTANYIQYSNKESDLIELYVNNDHWREVVILYSGHLQNSDAFLVKLKRKVDTAIWGDDCTNIRSWLFSVKDVSDSFSNEYLQSAFFALVLARALVLFRGKVNLEHRKTAIDIAINIAFSLDTKTKEDFGDSGIHFYSHKKRLSATLVKEVNLGTNFNQVEMSKFILYLKSQLLLVECVNSSIYTSRNLRDKIENSILSVS